MDDLFINLAADSRLLSLIVLIAPIVKTTFIWFMA